MAKKNVKKPTILVVEDERPLLEAIKRKLQLNGFEVVTARSADQAFSYLADIKGIDVVWLDHYLLGKESGLEFLVKLKGDTNWKKIPVFVVSNTASAQKVNSYISLGVNKYYTKADYRLDQIISDIKDFLIKKRG